MIDDGRDFKEIRPTLKKILEYEDPDPDPRSGKWQTAAAQGELFPNPEEFLSYPGDNWKEDIKNLKKESITDSFSVKEMQVFKFYQAAAIYRTHVLRDLLPKHGLIMD